MAVVAGNFTPSDLVTAQIFADRMFADDVRRPDFTAYADIVAALRAEQTANVSILEDSEKDRDVKVTWLNSCGDEAVDLDGDDCDLAGKQLGSDSKTYELTQGAQISYTVDEMRFRTNDYNVQQAIAEIMLRADKALTEKIAADAVARLETFRGVNVVTDGVGTPNGVSGDTDIAAADFENARIFAYLLRVSQLNKLTNPFLLSGSNLFEERVITRMSQANDNGKGAAALFAMMREYVDLFNIDSANAPDMKTYMINRGSIAFAAKNYYGTTPVQYKQQDRYSVPMRNLPGYSMDVIYTNRCSGATMLHDFKFQIKYDWLLNPVGCTVGRTGILSFNKTA